MSEKPDPGPQGRLDVLVGRFADFVNSLHYSVDRAEEPYCCAVNMSAEDAADLLPVFDEVLRLAEASNTKLSGGEAVRCSAFLGGD